VSQTSRQNHFELLGLPSSYDLDLSKLAENYRLFQAQAHPDRFAQADAAQRRAAMQLAAQANDAYRTLKDPVNRAEYLLALSGKTQGSGNRQLSPSFLEEQMALRERLQEITDQSDPEAALEAFEQQLNNMIELQKEQLASAFSDPAETLEQANNLVQELRFLDKLRQQVEELEERLI